MKRNLSTILIFALLPLCQTTHAASQLAPVFGSLVKYHQTGAMPPEVDFSKVVPSEEIPAIISAINSGNPILMDAAVESARSILGIHINDDLTHPHQLQIPLSEVMQAFQALVPIVIAHFNDPMPLDVGGVNGLTDYVEIKWKTTVVKFMDAMGATPSSDMIAWMVKIVQWPNDGGRAEKGVTDLESDNKASGLSQPSKADHTAMVETNKRNEQANALEVLPTLAHLNPMSPSVMSVVLAKIDNNDYPRAAELAIFYLSQNKSVNRSEFAVRMTAKALDTSAPESVRIAAQQAVDTLAWEASNGGIKK